MDSRRLIQNATIVSPDRVLPNASLLIENGRIAAFGATRELQIDDAAGVEVIDVGGNYLLPGLIDLHTDTLEKEITPRPAADFPIDIAVQELDRKLVGCGITTVYHSLHFGYLEAEHNNRSRYTRRDVVDNVRAMAASHTLAKTRIHVRFEIAGHGPRVRDLVCALIDEGVVDLLSFMDHTPGQGQYTLSLFFERQKKNGLDEKAARASLAEKQNRPRLSFEEMRAVAQRALALGIPIASHDDDTPEKVRQMHELGVTICEFPVNLVAAQAARACGQHVLGGASNVLRGGSLTGNLNVTEAIEAGAIDGLCSDYYPPAMLHAVFKLWRDQVLSLPQAVAAVSLVPAQAAGIAEETGSISVGKDADLIVIGMRGAAPVLVQTH
ncbi:MAG: alpha-D-ribose 1-methylphosphonate 5-triphosphate diphosphatase, partial [Opitutaceae bacterium]